MTLPASGAISFGDVNTELGLSATAQISLGDAAVRGLFGIASGAIDMNTGHGKSSVSYLYPGAVNNYNMFTAAGSPAGVVSIICVVNSNIGSTSTASPAFTTGSGWAVGSTLSVVNNATIAGLAGQAGYDGGGGASGSNGAEGSGGSGGAGGVGYGNGSGGSSGAPGGAGVAGGAGGDGGNGTGGGIAFQALRAVSLTNNGSVVRGAGGRQGYGGPGGAGYGGPGGGGGGGGGAGIFGYQTASPYGTEMFIMGHGGDGGKASTPHVAYGYGFTRGAAVNGQLCNQGGGGGYTMGGNQWNATGSAGDSGIVPPNGPNSWTYNQAGTAGAGGPGGSAGSTSYGTDGNDGDAGAAGAAISGTAYVTLLVTGTITGSQV